MGLRRCEDPDDVEIPGCGRTTNVDSPKTSETCRPRGWMSTQRGCEEGGGVRKRGCEEGGGAPERVCEAVFAGDTKKSPAPGP
jgi:hypothetical protein